MSVFSKYQGYDEFCGLSHEFRRRACTLTPTEVSWAGDLIVYPGTKLKQSEVSHFNGGDSEAATITYTTPDEEHCDDFVGPLPDGKEIIATAIRSYGEDSFSYAIPKAEDGEDETQWDTDIYQAELRVDLCGMMGHDGGDCLYDQSIQGKIKSICGTIDISGANPEAWFLDNRKSYADDPDTGLLVVAKTGYMPTLQVLFSAGDNPMPNGIFPACTDVTTSFMEALAQNGLAVTDVLEFGMI